MYALLSIVWLLLALGCVIILPPAMLIVPAFICAGISLYCTARSAN